MALSDVVQAVADALVPLTGYDQILTEPPASLPDDRCFVVWVAPGEAVALAHGPGATYEADDDVRVDFYIRRARDAMAEVEPEARTQLQATRDALFAGARSGNLSRVIVGFAGIGTDVYGPLTYWEADTAFGFSLAVRVRHAVSVP
jgi:hypothetical protein